MSIDWTHFTPWSSLAGGLLIGLAAAMLVLLSGRIAGVSGIVGGLIALRRGDIAWRLAFVGGLLVAPLAMHRCRVRQPRARRPAGRPGHPLRLGVHQRPRRVRTVAPVAALAGRHRRLHGRRHRHRLRHAAPSCMRSILI
jgi:uncharacterized membrane protein YedE/YeeE